MDVILGYVKAVWSGCFKRRLKRNIRVEILVENQKSSITTMLVY